MQTNHMLTLLYYPKTGWRAIREKDGDSLAGVALRYVLLIALIPPLSLFVGMSFVGWSPAGGDIIRMDIGRALAMAITLYIAMLSGLLFVSYCTFWMERTFGVNASFERCLVFIFYVSTPVLLAGSVTLLPVIWLNFFVMLMAISYSIYLLYTGIPVFMDIPAERGFIFASSIVTAGLCAMLGVVALLVIVGAG